VEKHSCQSDEWIVAAHADENHAGFRVKKCDVCDDVIAIEEFTCCDVHEFGAFAVSKEATETENGFKIRTCNACGYEDCETILSSSSDNGLTLVDNSTLSIDAEKDVLFGIFEGITVDEIKDNLKNSNVVVCDYQGAELSSDDVVITGTLVRLMSGETVKEEISIAVTGDVYADGKIDIKDVIRIKQYLSDKNIPISNAELKAADINSDDVVNYDDLTKLCSQLVVALHS